MTTSSVEETRHGDVAVFTLDNPLKRNALDPPLCLALSELLATVHQRARAVVLTGRGDKAFCSGFDVAAITGEVPEDLDANPFDGLINAVAACHVPLVCALNGVAFGGGLELAATCDLRVAHANIKLSMPPARLGIIYSPRGLGRFAALVGESRARELFLTARALDGSEAAAWGLVDHLVTETDVVARAVALAAQMAALAPLAVQGMRRIFEELLLARSTVRGARGMEIDRLRLAAWGSADAEEGRRAFAEKRKPLFRGS